MEKVRSYDELDWSEIIKDIRRSTKAIEINRFTPRRCKGECSAMVRSKTPEQCKYLAIELRKGIYTTTDDYQNDESKHCRIVYHSEKFCISNALVGTLIYSLMLDHTYFDDLTIADARMIGGLFNKYVKDIKVKNPKIQQVIKLLKIVNTLKGIHSLSTQH